MLRSVVATSVSLLVIAAASCGSSGHLGLGATTTSTSTTAPATTAPTTTAPTTTAPTTTLAPTTTEVPLPTVDTEPLAPTGYNAKVEPSTIYLSGDATNIVYGIRWVGWNVRGATGYGTVNILGCIPDCASGTSTPTPVTGYLNNDVNGAFTLLTEIIKGRAGTNYTLPTS